MNLATVLLFFPLLGGARQSPALSQLVEEYGDQRAAQTAAACLRALPVMSADEQPIARFLLASDLAELGASDLAARELTALLDSPEIGAPAFVALARVYDETEQSVALLARARQAPWRALDGDDFAEAAYRMARAALREGHPAQARDWAAQIPADSAYHTSARVLRLQAQSALAPAAAMAVADDMFHVRPRTAADRWLQDRTAIVTGDLLTEMGMYADAVAVLEWPSASSPFHERAEHDRRLALALLSASATSSDYVAVEQSRSGREDEIRRAAGAEQARRAELQTLWPSQRLTAERRRWTAAAAGAGLEAGRGGWHRPLTAVWYSLPPVMAYEMVRARSHDRERDTQSPVDAQSRFFFTPRPQVARWLTAVALASEQAAADGCEQRQARAIELRAAGSLGGVERAMTLGELRTIAAGCPDANANVGALRAALEAKLDAAIAAEASRQLAVSREQGFAVSTAIADGELERKSRLHAAGGTDR